VDKEGYRNFHASCFPGVESESLDGVRFWTLKAFTSGRFSGQRPICF
jgi:hypothetical protein